jgi:hypothetical protein
MIDIGTRRAIGTRGARATRGAARAAVAGLAAVMLLGTPASAGNAAPGAASWLLWGQAAGQIQPWTPEMLIPVQSTDPDDPEGEDDTPSYSSPSDPRGESDVGQPVTEATTDVLVARIAEVNAVCDWLLQPYRLWCLANGYDLMAETLLPFGGYRDVRQVLRRTANQLRVIAEANVDPEAEPVVLRRREGGATAVGNAPIRAVRRDAVAATNRQAAAVLDEATTVLLRSAENSSRRQVSYQRIAQAIDSSKVLLRST